MIVLEHAGRGGGGMREGQKIDVHEWLHVRFTEEA